MDKVILSVSIILFFWVMFVKKIHPVSLYTLFGMEWFFYLIFPLLFALEVVPHSFYGGYTLHYDKDIQFYFFLFNGVSMLVFTLVYYLFYKRKESKNGASGSPAMIGSNKYRYPLFLILLTLNIIMIIMSFKYPYIGSPWWAHSISANLRNGFIALFIFYMLLKPNRQKLYFLFFLFAVSTIIYGGRAYLIILAISFFFYLYNVGLIKMKHIMVLFVTSIIFLSLTGMIRSGLANSWERVIHYMLMPMYGESMNSAYPSFSVIKMWKNDQIKYHTYFGSYFIDPVLIFVPQFAFKAEGAPKDSYNILGKWEEDHGGRKGISPQGSYHYLAEAIEALSVPGIIIVSVAIAFACIYMESIKFSTLLKQFTYYTFAGTIGVGFVSDQFAWCIRSFGMSFEVLFTFLFLVEVFSLRKKAIGLLIRERA